MSAKQTYDRYRLKTILPAEGWQAVYDCDGVHRVLPVHALALAYCTTYDAQTWRPVHEPHEEQWEIVGLDYDVGGGWAVCDTMGNYCGLLPPAMALAEFEEASGCTHRHEAERKETA